MPRCGPHQGVAAHGGFRCMRMFAFAMASKPALGVCAQGWVWWAWSHCRAPRAWALMVGAAGLAVGPVGPVLKQAKGMGLCPEAATLALTLPPPPSPHPLGLQAALMQAEEEEEDSLSSDDEMPNNPIFSGQAGGLALVQIHKGNCAGPGACCQCVHPSVHALWVCAPPSSTCACTSGGCLPTCLRRQLTPGP